MGIRRIPSVSFSIKDSQIHTEVWIHGRGKQIPADYRRLMRRGGCSMPPPSREVTLSQVKDSWMITGEQVCCGAVSTPISTSVPSLPSPTKPPGTAPTSLSRSRKIKHTCSWLLEHSSAGRCLSRRNSQHRCLKWLQFLHDVENTKPSGVFYPLVYLGPRLRWCCRCFEHPGAPACEAGRSEGAGGLYFTPALPTGHLFPASFVW